MDYEKLTQSIIDINFLKRENNIFTIIELIKRVGLQQGTPKKEELKFISSYISVMCKQKDMKKQFYIDSLFESLKTLQLVVKKGFNIDVKIIIIKMIVFAGENQFIEDGLYLSKYFYFYQKKSDVIYPEFFKSLGVMGWKLSIFEIDVAKNIVEVKDKDQNQFVLINRVKLLQKVIGGTNDYYFEEVKSNLQLVGHLLSEKDIYYKEYLLLSHKMIITQIKAGKKIEMNQISSFYIHNLNQGSINEDQFGGLLVELLSIKRENSFEKYLVHSIIIDCLAQISSKSGKNDTLFYNKNVVTMIEVLCSQLDDPQLIEKVAHYLGEAPPNPKIKHISLLLKISNALKEEKNAIETNNDAQNNNKNTSKFTILHNKEDSNISSSSTAINTFSNYSQNTQNSIFSMTVQQPNKIKFKSIKNQKQSCIYKNKRKRLSNAKLQDTEDISQKENISDQSDNEDTIANNTQFNNNMMSEEEESQNNHIKKEFKQFNMQYFQHKVLNKIKEEDQFFRLYEEYQELDIKDIGGIQKIMAYKIFNQIQDLKSIYFNVLLNSREIMKDLEENQKNLNNEDKRRNKYIDEQIDQDLLNVLLIQNQICEIVSEQDINRQEIKSSNLFLIFLFFLTMIQEQDNIDFNYKRYKTRGGSNLYSAYSVQFKQLVEDILKCFKYPSVDKNDQKSSKSRSQQTFSDYKKRLEDQRLIQINYFIRTSQILFQNQINIGSEICYDLLETIMENLNCQDIDQILLIVFSYSQEENIDIFKKLRIIADRSIDLLLESHMSEIDNFKLGQSRRLSSSVQKEQKMVLGLEKLKKSLECITIINLIYLNTGLDNQLKQDFNESLIVIDLRRKLDEIKECNLKDQNHYQQLFVQQIMEKICRYLFNQKRKQKYSVQLNINEIFDEVGKIFICLLKWNKEVSLQFQLLLQYMEFNDFCVTQLLQDMNEGVDEIQEAKKSINLIRRLTIQNFEQFYQVENLDESDDKAFNKVLIQILIKLTQILNSRFNGQISQNQNHNFQTINIKLALVNKIIYLILENRMKETSQNINLMSTQLIYEGGSYYNQILHMLQETSDDIYSVLEWNFNIKSKELRNQQYQKVEHTYSFLVNVMLSSEEIQESQLHSRYEFLKLNLSWYDIKQLLHTIRYMREQSAYFKVGILSANLILLEIFLLGFLKQEGEFLKSNNIGIKYNNFNQNQQLQDQRIIDFNENEIKEEYYQKFIELLIEENIEQYIKILYEIQEYEESRKIYIYSQANSQVEDIQYWLAEIKRTSKGKARNTSNILQKYRAQLKCLIHNLSVIRIENNSLLSVFAQSNSQCDSTHFKKSHLRDIMKVVDKIENKIERNDRRSTYSSIKSSLRIDYLLMSLKMNLICAKYIRQSNQSHLATQIIEKSFRKLTSLCFEKAQGQLCDIYFNQDLQQGGSQRCQASNKTTLEFNSYQSLMGSLIDPFSKIQNLQNEQRCQIFSSVTSDLIDYLNVGNGFSYFKTFGSQKIQLLLLQSLNDYCRSQSAQNCFTNIKWYGKLLQIASARFMQFDELLKIQANLKDFADSENCRIFIDVIGNILLQKQIEISSLHNLLSRRKSSVVTMQLSTFIQTLNMKLLTQNTFLQKSCFFKASMKYMISLFTTTVRPNHKNLESEICQMYFFKSKKFSCVQSQLPSFSQDFITKQQGYQQKMQKNLKQAEKVNIQNDDKSNIGFCDFYISILSINTQSNSPYIIVSKDFHTHIISHKNCQSFILRYFFLLQSLNLLKKVTACRENIAKKVYDTLNVNFIQNNDIYYLFIQMINFREISKNLHNTFLSYHQHKSKQFFYLYHKFDETIKEILREMPSLFHIYSDFVTVKSCECVCQNESKASLIQGNQDSFLFESFSLDASYIYKSMLIHNQESSQDMEQEQLIEDKVKIQNSSRQSKSSSSSNKKLESVEKIIDQDSLKTQKQEEEDQSYTSKQNLSYTQALPNIILTQADFEFKKLRTSMRDFSISKYTKSKLTQNLGKSFKNSRFNVFAYRKHSLQQLKLEHDLIIFNFIDYNNERAIQISKFNHLTKKFSSFRINSQTQSNLFADYMQDIKKILQNNESEMRDEEKKRISQINPDSWWKNRLNNDKRLQNLLFQISQILDYHIFLFFGSENSERELQIINNLSEKLKTCEQLSHPEKKQTDYINSSDQNSFIEEKDNLLEILLSLIKCSLFFKLNVEKYKLIFEFICVQNIYLQYLGLQSQQYLFQQIIKIKDELSKNYTSQTKKPQLWILSENIQLIPLEFISFFPENKQTFYRIPSIKYLCENYVSGHKVNFSNNYYLLNPSGDLEHTQKNFQKKFESIRSWEGASGISVSSEELQMVLKSFESYTYIGHGAGEVYINQKQIQEIKNIKSSILLFGCQSARQVNQLDINSNLYEITGNSLYLLMNKCKMLTGSLWDITDRDTDNMVLKLISIFEKATKEKPIDFTQAFLQVREQ